MVNVSPSNFLLGLLDLLLAFAVPGISILAIMRQSPAKPLYTLLYVGQSILAFIIFIIAGVAFIVRGWALDPLMLFIVFLLHLLLIYLVARDAILLILQGGTSSGD